MILWTHGVFKETPQKTPKLAWDLYLLTSTSEGKDAKDAC